MIKCDYASCHNAARVNGQAVWHVYTIEYDQDGKPTYEDALQLDDGDRCFLCYRHYAEQYSDLAKGAVDIPYVP